MCSHKVPSCASAQAPLATCPGVGKIGLSLFATIIHQTAIRSAIRIIGGTTLTSLPSILLTVPLFRFVPPVRCPRLLMPCPSACANASAIFPTPEWAAAPR